MALGAEVLNAEFSEIVLLSLESDSEPFSEIVWQGSAVRPVQSMSPAK